MGGHNQPFLPMKTTRTLRHALVAIVAANLAAYMILHASLPVAAIFEYATGMLVAAGLCAFLVAEPGHCRSLTADRDTRSRSRGLPTFA